MFFNKSHVAFKVRGSAQLEVQLQSKLDLPLGYHYVRDDARRARPIRNEGIRLLKHGMVKCVEELGAKLQILILGKVEKLAQR